MVRRLLRPLVIGVGVVALQLLSASSAFAYFLTVQANAVCTDGVATIHYTAGSWGTHAAATNTAVNVLFNGVVVDTQPFVLPTNSFSGSEPAPAGATSVTVTVIGAGVWGDGFTGTGTPASTTVTIPTNCEEVAAFGRFTGGPNAIEIGGAKVTTGLQIHCHPKDPSVNFESPLVTPQPPKAPVDTMVAVGFGKYNGQSGYTIEFTLIDSGEPDNKRTDQMRILIYPTGNPADVKLNVPLQNISAGNIQAHYDQPHSGNGTK